MSIERALIGTTDASAAASVYVEDVFSTYLYTGTGASQTITNGIDLSTKGGLVWLKSRSAIADHALYDTARGATFDLGSNLTTGQTTQSTGLTSFGTTGFTIGALAKLNTSAATYTSWTFRKQPKFFDIVTYTGNGSARTISHSLGATPGMIIVKRTDTTGNWKVYHSGQTSAAFYTHLNATTAQTSDTTVWNSTAPTSSVFSVGTHADVNANAGTYVAYLFAASSSGGFGASGTDSVVACGNFTTDASGNVGTVSLGWEPQYILCKASSAAQGWYVFDTMRGWTTSGNTFGVQPNATSAELDYSAGTKYLIPTATGFTGSGNFFGLNTSVIYLAIRRGPMKTPTDATKVFSPITASTGGSVQTTGFPIDSQWKGKRATDTLNFTVDDRLRGVTTIGTSSGRYLTTSATTAEATTNPTTLAWDNTGFSVPTYYSGASSIYWNFSRAPGFFDVVCYKGGQTSVSHGLGVVPEMAFIKVRDTTGRNWIAARPGGVGGYLNTTDAINATNLFVDLSSATSTTFPSNLNIEVGNSSYNYVAYLFASCPGVSKVGSYTGNGSSQTINCGFAAGARFVLIRRTDSTGDWYVWDTARGINASANDPHLSLNTTAAEVTTDDSIDPASTGFTVRQATATNINVSAATYIYLAIA